MADEKIYNIPLREAYKKNRIDRANYAVKIVESYLKTHTKKKNVKLGMHLNSFIWSRGPKKPPRMIRVKAIIDKDLVKAEILGKEYVEFIAQAVKKKEKLLDKLKARIGEKALQKAEEEKMVEEGKTLEEVKKEEEKTEESTEETPKVNKEKKPKKSAEEE